MGFSTSEPIEFNVASPDAGSRHEPGPGTGDDPRPGSESGLGSGFHSTAARPSWFSDAAAAAAAAAAAGDSASLRARELA